MSDRHSLVTNELLELTFKGTKTITESDKELLPVFSKEGEYLGVAPRLLCHRLGLIHKVVYLFINNLDGKVLTQARSDGRIDVPVGGHVSTSDISEKQALVREMFEELGVTVDENRIIYHQTYFREFDNNTNKTGEMNREIRVLYLLNMDENDEKNLNSLFSTRKDKNAVVGINWMSIDEIISCCDNSLVADGLKSSLPHYLSKI